MSREEINEAIRRRMKERKVFIRALAVELGINERTLGNKLRGDADFTLTELLAIGEILGLTMIMR